MKRSLKKKILIGLCVLAGINLFTPTNAFFTISSVCILGITIGMVFIKDKPNE